MTTGTKEPTKHVHRAVFLPTIWELKSECYLNKLYNKIGESLGFLALRNARAQPNMKLQLILLDYGKLKWMARPQHP
jgi:hypothetical protein